MKRKVLISVAVGLAFTLTLAGAVSASRARAPDRGPQEALGTAFTYQGQLADDGDPVTADCNMAFRLYDQAASGSQEGDAITATVPISDGLFTARLDFGAGPFDGETLWLGIRVSCPGDAGWTDLGRQDLTAAPYALYALGAPWTGIRNRPAGLDDGDHDTLYYPGAGLDLLGTTFSVNTSTTQQRVVDTCPAGSAIRAISQSGTVDCEPDDNTGFDAPNVIVIAQSGGDFPSIQAAVDSIGDASELNPYLVWVAPGVYDDQVTLQPYVHLQGAGQDATILTSKAGNNGSSPSVATLVLTANVSVRDLTVRTVGEFERNTAVLAEEGVSRTLLSNVTVEASGAMTNNYGIYLYGGGIDVTINDATVIARGGSGNCYALENGGGAAATLRGGAFIARDAGNAAIAIYNISYDTTLDADAVTAIAEDGGTNTALNNSNGPMAVIRGGLFRARGPTACAIRNQFSDASLQAIDVTAIAEIETGASYPIGLRNTNTAHAVVYGGSFTAVGGNDACGIYNADPNTTLLAESVTAVGRDCVDECSGLFHRDYATATLSSGSFVGRGGADASGIYFAAGALDAVAITAVGEGAGTNYGLNVLIGSVGTVSQSRLEGATNSVNGGVITVTNSLLIGPAVGDVRCLLVARDASVSSNTPPYTCP